MVGSDGREDGNHRQLHVGAGKSLGGLLQALRYQPIRHLQTRNEEGVGRGSRRLQLRRRGLGDATMQQSVEQRWSRLQGEESSSTLYWSVRGSLSRTSFSTFQSVSCGQRNGRAFYLSGAVTRGGKTGPTRARILRRPRTILRHCSRTLKAGA